MSALDPLTFAGVGAAVVAVALVASWLPARRARLETPPPGWPARWRPWGEPV